MLFFLLFILLLFFLDGLGSIGDRRGVSDIQATLLDLGTTFSILILFLNFISQFQLLSLLLFSQSGLLHFGSLLFILETQKMVSIRFRIFMDFWIEFIDYQFLNLLMHVDLQVFLRFWTWTSIVRFSTSTFELEFKRGLLIDLKIWKLLSDLRSRMDYDQGWSSVFHPPFPHILQSIGHKVWQGCVSLFHWILD